jgi:hypothetical protein
LKVKIVAKRQNARNLSEEKELLKYWEVIGISKVMPVSIITAHCWGSRGSRWTGKLHVSVWIHDAILYTSGYGTAGGSGYHKVSAAMEMALKSAGVELSESLNGDTAIEDALRAIAESRGFTRLVVLTG